RNNALPAPGPKLPCCCPPSSFLSSSLRSTVGESSAAFRQLHEQRRRLPVLPMLCMEATDGLQHLGQAYGIRIEHRPAAEHREAVTSDVNHVDIRRALGNAVLHDARSFVHQGIDGASDDLFIGNFASHDAGFGSALRNK